MSASGFDWATLAADIGVAVGTIGAVWVSLRLAHQAREAASNTARLDREHMARQINAVPTRQGIVIYNGSSEPITSVEARIAAAIATVTVDWWRGDDERFVQIIPALGQQLAVCSVGTDKQTPGPGISVPISLSDVRAKMRWVDSLGILWEREYGHPPVRLGDADVRRPSDTGFAWEGF